MSNQSSGKCRSSTSKLLGSFDSNHTTAITNGPDRNASLDSNSKLSPSSSSLPKRKSYATVTSTAGDMDAKRDDSATRSPRSRQQHDGRVESQGAMPDLDHSRTPTQPGTAQDTGNDGSFSNVNKARSPYRDSINEASAEAQDFDSSQVGTSDSKSANGLNVEATWTGTRTCTVCLEERSDLIPRPSKECDNDIHPPGSNTGVCPSCIARCITEDLENFGPENIRCPVCPVALTYEDIQLRARPNTFERYDYLLTEACLDQDDEFVYCANPQCGKGQLHAGGSDYPIMTCNACGQKTCATHRMVWHEGFMCYEIDHPETSQSRGTLEHVSQDQKESERQERSREEMEGERFVRETSRACPGCGWFAYRIGGCKHMTCSESCH